MVIRPWTADGRRTIHRDRWVDLSAERVTTATGAVLDPYYTLAYPDWAVAFALTPEGQVVMIRQYRHAAALIDLDLPGGCVDPEDATPLLASRRELREETGYDSDEADYLGRFAANPALQTNYVHVTLLRNAVRIGEPAPEAGEEVAVELLSVEAVGRAAVSGAMANAMHIAAVFLVMGRLGKLQF